MNELCKQIAVEKDPEKYKKLSLELNDLVKDTLKSVQPRPRLAGGQKERSRRMPTF